MEVDELFDKLDAAGMELEPDVKVCMLLRSLPPSFDSLVAALDSRPDEDLLLDVVKSKLFEEYNRRLERESASEKGEKALRSSEFRHKESRTCHFCKRPGHLQRNCRKMQMRRKEEYSTSSVGKSAAKVVTVEEKGTAFTSGDFNSSVWLVDSGASAHMTSNRSFFTSLNKYAVGNITLANGKSISIEGEGSGTLLGINGEEKVVKIDIHGVKYVPQLSTNLLSVTKLTEKNFSVNFNKNECRIVNQDGVAVATGNRYGDLYHLRVVQGSMKATVGHSENCQHQWHRRLGHRDWAAIERANKEQLATGINVVDCGMKLVCECCLQGKSARLPFAPVAERKANQVLDIVHTDLCGPMQNVTPSDNRYVMTITDDFSRFTVSYLMKTKSEAIDNIKDYVRWTYNLFNRKPRVIRSDGGGEFNNKELHKFYKLEGIKAQFTMPYSPQQNGIAERKNRSLVEMANCMLIDADMHKRFWGEAILTATYLQNRLPSRSLRKTPHELWWGKKPDYSELHIFGCDAYVHIPHEKRRKFDNKARKLKFVGYTMDRKGFRLLDPETDAITVSRDVRFIELNNGSSSVDFSISSQCPDTKEESSFKEEPSKQIEECMIPDVFYEAEDLSSDPLEETRRSSRVNRGVAPQYLDEYELNSINLAALVQEEPINFKEAVECKEWRDAMKDELVSHHRNNTWELVPAPKGCKIVGSKWVYKVKRNEQNQIVKYKARVVAQGFTQRQGIDVKETFAPVAQQATLRTFLTVASKQKLIVRHLDIKTAYLYGHLEEDVYMRQPPGCAKAGQENLVCHLKRSIYGLRQSARCWNKRLQKVLQKCGFKISNSDPCLYIKVNKEVKVFLLVYVDDMLIASSSKR